MAALKLSAEARERVRMVALRDLARAEDFYRQTTEPLLLRRREIYQADKDLYKRMFPRLGFSDYTSHDFYAWVQWALSKALDSFFGTTKVISIVGQGQGDAENAQVMEELIKWQLEQGNKGFMLFSSWFEDTLVYDLGVLKCWWSRVSQPREETVTVPQDRLREMAQTPGVELLDVGAPDFYGDCQVTLRRMVTTDNRPVLDHVSPFDMRWLPEARRMEESLFVAQRQIVTGDVLLRGAKEGVYDRDEARRAVDEGGTVDYEMADQVLNPDLEMFPAQEDDAARRRVEIFECYVKHDVNGDGTGDGLAPQTESLVHAPLASMAMLNQGGDLIVDSFAEAEKAIDWAGVNGDVRIDGRKGFIPFVAAGGNKLREEVGSYVDIDGWNFNAGAAKLTRNNLLWGVFGEYGRTSYTGHLDSGQSANGNGHYTGGGVFARKKNPGGLYYEGSFRAGRVKNDYKSDSMIKPGEGAVHTEYDYKSDYYAAHVGIGVAQQVGRRNVLDYYLRWFYTHQDGFDAALSSGENYQFDDVESSRLRLGLRYSCVLNKYSTLYLGGAWQYEFEGDSKAMYAGYNTLVPSLNGSSGMFEFGWQVKPSERSPLTLDFGAAGWFGRQKGASFRFSARWDL